MADRDRTWASSNIGKLKICPSCYVWQSNNQVRAPLVLLLCSFVWLARGGGNVHGSSGANEGATEGLSAEGEPYMALRGLGLRLSA